METKDIAERILNIKKIKEIVLVSICGAADTGKTTMAGKICEILRSNNIRCDSICTDSFMVERAQRIEKGISGYHFKALKEKELLEFVTNIEKGEELSYFPYDNRIGKNVAERKFLKGVQVLIIEGIHSFNEVIRNKIDLKIFINANDETLRHLRFHANIHKRGFSEKEAGTRINQEMEEYYHFVEPNKKYANITLNIDKSYKTANNTGIE